MARRPRNPYNAKAYKFTQRRRYALKRAAEISARKRRIHVGIMAVGGVAAVGAGLYLGRNTETGKGVRRSVAAQVRRVSPSHVGRAMNLQRIRDRAVVSPHHKEAVRIANAVSPAHTPRNALGGAVIGGPPGSHHHPGPEMPKVYTHTQLPAEDPNIMRGVLAAEEAHRKSTEGSLQRFTDSSEATLPSELVAGQPVKRGTAARAVAQHEKAKGKSGGQARTPAERGDTVDQMIAGSIDHNRAIRGMPTAIRENPKANPTNVIIGGSKKNQEAYAQHEADWAAIDAHRGLSAVRPGTVPAVTIGHGGKPASVTPHTGGTGVSREHLSPGATIPGWHKMSKEGQKKVRDLLGQAGKKVSAAGKVSQPKASTPKKPKANPSASEISQQHAESILKKAGFSEPAARGKPSQGTTVGGWHHMTEAQKKAAHKYAARFHMAINPMGQYYDLIN